MAQIEKSTIIKLRQSESNGNYELGNDVRINGAFNIILNKPVILETGDTVRLHTAILDSSAPEVIDITEDVNIEIDVCRYLNYYQNITMPAGPTTGGGVATASNYIYERVGVPAFPAPNGAPGTIIPIPPIPDQTTTNKQYTPTASKYWAGITGSPSGDDTHKVLTVTFYRTGKRAWGGVPVLFRYTSPITGEQITVPVQCPPGKPGSEKLYFEVAVNIDVVGNQQSDFLMVSTVDYMDTHHINTHVDVKFGPLISPPASSKYSTPYIETLKITLPARRYQPGELCSVINDSISLMQLQGDTGMDTETVPSKLYPTENPFLGTIRQMEDNITKTYPAGTSLAFMREADNYSERVEEMIRIDTNKLEGAKNDMWCGANQVSLNYDPVLEKINFAILHFPIYVPLSGGATDFVPGVQYDEEGRVASTYSGVTIMGLRPQIFWTETMGFNTLTNSYQHEVVPFREIPLQIDPSTKLPYAGSGTGDWIHPFKMIGTPGVNITDVYMGIDLPVSKDATFWGVANGATALKVTQTATSLTLPIFSTRVFNSPLDDEGYFLIEIGFAFAQKMIGASTVYNNIQSIVGKYFTSQGNFLQDQGSGSINYQHLGDSQLLTDISVRILNADGTLLPDTVLGPKNSVFLELIKTLNLPAQKTTLAKS